MNKALSLLCFVQNRELYWNNGINFHFTCICPEEIVNAVAYSAIHLHLQKKYSTICGSFNLQ